MKELKETGDSRYIYQKELDKTCCQHDLAYGGFNYLNRRTVANKVLSDKAFYIAKTPKYDDYQRGLASMVCKCFNKITCGGAVKNEIMSIKN